MKQIYNEGRIVGLSQYELYVRQLMSTNPEATPMTEREWLTSTLANNISMILKVPAGTPKGIHDYVLPQGSNLAACTQVFGSMFQGEVTVDKSGYWATRVDDFGAAISNTEELHPETPGLPENVPCKADPTAENTTIIERAQEFLKVRQALVIQPGDWEDAVYPPDPEPTPDPDPSPEPEPEPEPDPDPDTGETVTWLSPIIAESDDYDPPSAGIITTEYDEWLVDTKTGTEQEMIDDLSPYDPEPDPPIPPIPPTPPTPPEPARAKKYLSPDFHERGFVRILLTEQTENDLYILFHGFVDKLILTGEVSYQFEGQSNRPQDGDFLGPSMFPWSCPVTLIISTDVAEVIIKEQTAEIDKLKEITKTLNYHTIYLGTLHQASWDTPLESEQSDTILTEDGDFLLGTKEGSVSQMWQDDAEGEIVYNALWLDQDERIILTKDGIPMRVPKFGTVPEMFEEGGIL